MKEFMSYMVILLIFLFQCPSQSMQHSDQLRAIRKYVSHRSSGFFVSLGSYQKMNSAIAYQLKGWNGIILQENKEKAKFSLMNSVQVETLALRISNQTESSFESYSLSLLQVCSSYYLIKPQLMIMSDSDSHFNALMTANWIEYSCLPNIIIVLPVKDRNFTQPDDVTLTLRSFGYGNDPRIGQIRIYVKMNEVFHLYTDFLQNQRKFAHQNHTMFIKETNLPSLYNKLLPNTTFDEKELLFPQKIYIYDMKHHVLSLPDAIEASEYFSQELKPIVVLNFRAKTDAVYLGSKNYTIQQLKIDEFTFKHISITSKNQIDHDVYVLLDEKNKWIQIINEQGEQFFEQSSGIIRRSYYSKGCIQTNEKVQVAIINKQRFQSPLALVNPKLDLKSTDPKWHQKYHHQDNNTDSQSKNATENMNITEEQSNTTYTVEDIRNQSSNASIKNEQSIANKTELFNESTHNKSLPQNITLINKQQVNRTIQVEPLEKEQKTSNQTEQSKQTSPNGQNISKEKQIVSKNQSQSNHALAESKESKDNIQISNIINELSKEISYVNQSPNIENAEEQENGQHTEQQTSDTSDEGDYVQIQNSSPGITEKEFTENNLIEETIPQKPNKEQQPLKEEPVKLKEEPQFEQFAKIAEQYCMHIFIALLVLVLLVSFHCCYKEREKNVVRNEPVQLQEDEMFGESSERF